MLLCWWVTAVSGVERSRVELHAQTFSSWLGARKAPVKRPQYSLL